MREIARTAKIAKNRRNWWITRTSFLAMFGNFGDIGNFRYVSLFLMLHITNGDSVTGTFRQVRFPGTYLAWKDSLHDGPGPQTEALSELCDLRAQALAGFGCGDYEKRRGDFATRDPTRQGFRKHQVHL